MNDRTLIVALAGNPNSGKTTIFNALTGSRQHVGNYPGVTVEKKEGRASHNGLPLRVVDLPGTYSLTAYSVEEIVARNFLIDDPPDVVVDIIDSANLERNLYLATQFMELGVPLVLAFNMSDVAQARGTRIDHARLSELLGVPIVQTVGNKGLGIGELLATAVGVGQQGDAAADRHRPIHYGREIEPHVAQLTDLVSARCGVGDRRARWFAVKMLENDRETASRLRRTCPEHCEEVFAEAGRLRRHIEGICGDAAAIVLADRRYGFISGACTESVRQSVEARHDLSDQIDAVLTNRWLGLPIFAALMYLVFQLTFTLGGPCVDFLDWLLHENLAVWVSQLWPRGSDSLLKSLVVDGVIGGVGVVVVFVPLIAMLFLAIAMLEDTGYMARAAFIMDRLMHRIGLHGKSFIPLLIGFGCSVPAIMATRTLESRRDRLTTMLVVPLMSCGARLPIYMLFIPAFFPARWQTPMLWGIYVIGIVLAVVMVKLLRVTLLKGESAPFVMELPPYRMPTLRGLLVHMWERTWMFLRKAGTIIFALAVLLWAANTFPRKKTFDRDYDALAAQTAATYLHEVDRIGASLGMPPENSPLRRTVEAELAMDGLRARHWQRERAYRDAQAQADAAVERLTKQAHGDALAAFLKTRREVLKIREGFSQSVRDLEVGTAEYAHRRHLRDGALSELAKAQPRAYEPAVLFLDEAKAPYDRRLAELRAQKRAEELAHSVSGRVGRAVEPVLRPLGFDWKIGTALIGAFGAKEAFVTQMGIVYSLGEGADEEMLRTRLRQAYDPLVAFCIMLFCLVSAPCLATIVVTARESGSWRWGMLQLGGLTVLAYVLTAAVYQMGRLVV
ncbi:MAG TPA: ferrous iron transport protein B [Phycisphaerae bacterium]|nr:ferrous iron transport protein B [Phycisphaerae bacterium]